MREQKHMMLMPAQKKSIFFMPEQSKSNVVDQESRQDADNYLMERLSLAVTVAVMLLCYYESVAIRLLVAKPN